MALRMRGWPTQLNLTLVTAMERPPCHFQPTQSRTGLEIHSTHFPQLSISVSIYPQLRGLKHPILMDADVRGVRLTHNEHMTSTDNPPSAHA